MKDRNKYLHWMVGDIDDEVEKQENLGDPDYMVEELHEAHEMMCRRALLDDAQCTLRELKKVTMLQYGTRRTNAFKHLESIIKGMFEDANAPFEKADKFRDARFLCMWNDWSEVEVHTFESLWNKYKDTNLFEKGECSWHYRCQYYDFEKFLEIIVEDDWCLGRWFHNDNMQIQLIEE